MLLQIPEYCRSMEESEIVDNAFNLIFAFDEIVALGYRESVNLAQIRTFVEMDSHEEKVYQAVRKVTICSLRLLFLGFFFFPNVTYFAFFRHKKEKLKTK